MKMHYPKISIITPSFNQGQYLEECILSILNQNYPNLEYIIIDGGSDDNTLEIIRQYASHIHYWISEPDQGQSDAINKGLRQCQGEIINWLNADDFYEPDALFQIAKFFGENPALKVLCGRCRVIKDNNELSHVTQGTDIYPQNVEKTIGWARTDQPATFYRRDAVRNMGELDVDLHYLMDRDWWIKYLQNYGLEMVEKTSAILVNFRLHPASKTVSRYKEFQKDRDTYFFAFSQIHQLAAYCDFLKRNCQLDPNYEIKQLSRFHPSQALKILNYYLLLRADELYARNEKKKAQVYLDQVKDSLLQSEDQKLWRKIYFRNKYLPQILIRFLREVKSLFNRITSIGN